MSTPLTGQAAVDQLLEVLDLKKIDAATFRGESPQVGAQRVFGGQVAGQALVAAGRTVDPERTVHSLHGYFVRPGDPITVSLRDNLGPPVQAAITRTSGALDARSRTMLVEVELPNEDGLYRPGLFCDVEVTLNVPPMLQVPSEALLTRGGKSMVVVVDRGTAALRPVQAGSDDGRFVSIVSGVAEGDSVALHVPDGVDDGSRVRAVPARTSPH